MPPAGEKPPSRLLIISTVSFYIVAAIAMILANKWVLNNTAIPLFFLFAQLVIAVILLFVTDLFGIIRVPSKFDLTICKGLAPMVALNVLGLSCNNYTLKYVDASFYQVARGLVLPFTVALSATMLKTSPSNQILISCAIVTSGFFLGILIDNPSSITGSSPIGIFFGLVSSLTTAMHAVVIKRSFAVVQGNAIELAWYSNMLSACALIPLIILAGEAPDVLDLFNAIIGAESNVGLRTLNTFLWGSVITGVVGFLICVAGFLSIKVTSPITHMISSAVRGVFQSLFSMWLLGDIIATGRASSITIILIGSIYYTWVKHLESKEQENSRGVYTRAPTEEALESGLLQPNNSNGAGRNKDEVMMINVHGRSSELEKRG